MGWDGAWRFQFADVLGRTNSFRRLGQSGRIVRLRACMIDHPQELAPCSVLGDYSMFVALKYSRGGERDEVKTRV